MSLRIAAAVIAAVAFTATTVRSANAADPVSYTKEVRSLINVLCVACHAGGQPKAGIDLDSYEGLIKSNRKGAGVVPGKSVESLIYKVLTDAQGAKHMPPKKVAQPTDKEIDLIKRWIDEGAKDDSPKK